MSEVVRGGISRPPSKKAKCQVPEKNYHKERVAELRALGVKTEFLFLAPDGIDKNHMYLMLQGPLLHNQGHAGKLICFSLIFAYICTFRI